VILLQESSTDTNSHLGLESHPESRAGSKKWRSAGNCKQSRGQELRTTTGQMLMATNHSQWRTVYAEDDFGCIIGIFLEKKLLLQRFRKTGGGGEIRTHGLKSPLKKHRFHSVSLQSKTIKFNGSRYMFCYI